MRRAGFTLMEVLIALAITGMVMTTVLQTLDGTRKAVDAIHNIIETENTGPRILAQMREDLSRLAVHDVADYRLLLGENEMLFGFDADTIDFLVYAPSKIPFHLAGIDRPLHSSLNEVGYRLRENPQRKDFLELYRREDPLADDDPFEDGSFTLLYDRVVSMQLRYAAEPELNPMWKDDWDSQSLEALPYAIEIFLEIEVQPRRSAESLAILGANLARLQYEDVFMIPTETRWRFRNRMHPARLDAGEGEGEGEGEGTGEGEGEGEGEAAPGSTEGDPRSNATEVTGEGRGSAPSSSPGRPGG